ncbi:hypothetical protein AGMMS49531_05730 [Endomicrobiia bacterium]|nr:hypothetical protein AGMMS49531_05730 [Endomicrobiia bacterium]
MESIFTNYSIEIVYYHDLDVNSLYKSFILFLRSFFEVGLDAICDNVIVIWVPYAIQAKRLALRDNLSGGEIKKRIGSQMHMEEKVKLADFVIDNTGSKKDLRNKINDLYKLLTSKS